MTLIEWVNAHGGRGSGIVRVLVDASRTTHTTVGRVLRGGRVRDVNVARAISQATKRQVSVRELMQLTDDDCAPPAQLRRRKEQGRAVA